MSLLQPHRVIRRTWWILVVLGIAAGFWGGLMVIKRHMADEMEDVNSNGIINQHKETVRQNKRWAPVQLVGFGGKMIPIVQLRETKLLQSEVLGEIAAHQKLNMKSTKAVSQNDTSEDV